MLRAAIFGFGRMGRFHREVIDGSGLARVIAVADPALERDGIPGKDAPEIFSDPAELVAKAGPDVVHVVTPPSSHFELAKLALLHGAHVYVEKPFTPSAAEARELFAIAGNAGLKLCAGHQLLFHPATIKAGPLLGKLGKIVHIESFFSFRQVRKDISAAEQLLDILPHPVYLFLHFLEKSGMRLEDTRSNIKALDAQGDGELRVLLSGKGVTGSVTVSLKARPVDSRVRITGTKGSLELNYVRGTVIKSEPGIIALLTSPYSEAVKTAFQSGATFAMAALSRKHRYQGLGELAAAFYRSIIDDTPAPVPENLITECAALGELAAWRAEMSNAAAGVPAPAMEKDFVIVTGGTGFLGQRVVREMAASGRSVRVLARKLPAAGDRIPGADYRKADLSREPDNADWEGAGMVVHCAAATYGGRGAHEKNTVAAVRNVLEAAARAGVKKIVHISSLGILESAPNGNAVSEGTPVNYGDSRRGPYVWAKAEAEKILIEKGKELGLQYRIIRPGPLVDYESFQAPGRLGRRIGALFIAVGKKQSAINVCDVGTAARVISWCAARFEDFPKVLNLAEAPAPTRSTLVKLLAAASPEVRTIWVPEAAVGALSGIFKILFRLANPGKQPPDIRKIFASENYDLSLAYKVLREIKETA
ncbi:MAG: Gfo/Idh/MocA family oxidoreductase [Syntrophaceae bacterium]